MTITASSDTEQPYQDTDLGLSLVRAVMAPGERRGVPLDQVDEHKLARKSADGRLVWLPVEDLVSGRQAYMVKIADDLLVLDADSSAKVASLERIARELELDDYRHVVVQSGAEDHRHLFARVGRAYRAQAETRIAKLPDSDRPDIRGGRMVRPPLSPHPAGYPVALDGVGLAEAVSILQPMTAVALVDRLGRTARDALEHGAANLTAGDRSGSGVQFRVLLGCVRAGMTFAETERLFSGPYAGTERYRSARNPRRAHRQLHNDYRRAQAKLRDRVVVDDPQSARVALANVKAHADAHQWGPRDVTALAVLRGHIALAARQGRIAGYHASRRQLALAAGVSERSLKHTNARLIAEGWFDRLAEPTAEAATTWAFTPARQLAPLTHSTKSKGGVIEGGNLARTDYTDDIWRPAGLGHAAGYVANALDTLTPQTAAELADTLGYRSAGTVRRHLVRLEAVGLAHRSPDGWTRGEATVAKAAETARCTGESEWYKRQYERQQETRARKRARAKSNGMPVPERYVDLDTGEITTHQTFRVAEARTPKPWPYEADGQMRMVA